MNSKHLITQIKGKYSILANRMNVDHSGYTVIRVSRNDVSHATRMVESEGETWKTLIGSIKDQLGYKAIRNSGMMAAGFCHGAIFFIDNEQSIIITINTIFKIIGYYFDHYKVKGSHMVFPGAGTATISYWPYTKRQAESAVDIIDILLVRYPDYVVFDNLHASMHINESDIFEYEERELDLYRVLFSTNIHGAL